MVSGILSLESLSMSKNIVHQYFKKEHQGAKILIKVNPIYFKGTELTILGDGKIEMRDLEFDEGIFDDLKIDGFEAVNAIEFNLYTSGLL
jgi:hypothetical protein